MKLFFTVFALLNTLAFAEVPGMPGGSVASGMSPFIPLILIFAVFYFLIIRPQQKKTKLQQKFISELKRGDMVITNSGIIGTIRTVSDKFVSLEVDEGVCLKLLKSQVLENANSLKDEKERNAKEATT